MPSPHSGSRSKDVDAYIAGFPPKIRAVLQKVRDTVRREAPDAQELISYRMPAFRLRRILVYYAGWQNHIGLYPPVMGDEALMAAAKPYAGEKGNLQFPLGQPIPYGLIAKIVRYRVALEQPKSSTARRKSGEARTINRASPPSPPPKRSSSRIGVRGGKDRSG